MPATPIETLVKTWIGSNTAAGTRVSAGSRLQSAALPAIVIEAQSGEIASFYGPVGLNVQQYESWTISVRAVALTELDAVYLLEAAIGAISTNIASGSVMYEPTLRTIQAPIVGEGDEAEPSIAQQSIQILHRRP